MTSDKTLLPKVTGGIRSYRMAPYDNDRSGVRRRRGEGRTDAAAKAEWRMSEHRAAGRAEEPRGGLGNRNNTGRGDNSSPSHDWRIGNIGIVNVASLRLHAAPTATDLKKM